MKNLIEDIIIAGVLNGKKIESIKTDPMGMIDIYLEHQIKLIDILLNEPTYIK